MSKLQDLLDRKEKAERDKIRLEENLKNLEQNRDNKIEELKELGIDVDGLSVKDIEELIKEYEAKFNDLTEELEKALEPTGD